MPTLTRRCDPDASLAKCNGPQHILVEDCHRHRALEPTTVEARIDHDHEI
jgi:hypothetical protein